MVNAAAVPRPRRAQPAARRCFRQRPPLVRLHTPRLSAVCQPALSGCSTGPIINARSRSTFDDWPLLDSEASSFVSLLAGEHVPATFFEIGEHIAPYDPHGTIERQMLADGDMIGDHTWSHPDLVGLSAAAQREQICAPRRRSGWRPAGLSPACFARPTARSIRVCSRSRSMGLATIQWDVDPRDWHFRRDRDHRHVSRTRTTARSWRSTSVGPPLRDARRTTVRDRELRAKGYRLVTLTQMLGYKLVYR